MRFVMTAAMALALAACGNPDQPTGGGPGKVPPPASCAYHFQATVLMGPDSPLSLQGKLVLVQDTDTTLSGALIPPGGDTVPDGGAALPRVRVDGTLGANGSTISLSLVLPNGGKVLAAGPFSGSFAACPAPLSGSATGPAANDEGMWSITALLVDGT